MKIREDYIKEFTSKVEAACSLIADEEPGPTNKQINAFCTAAAVELADIRYELVIIKDRLKDAEENTDIEEPKDNG